MQFIFEHKIGMFFGSLLCFMREVLTGTDRVDEVKQFLHHERRKMVQGSDRPNGPYVR